MNEAKQRIIHSLSVAHACEQTLVRALESQIAVAPRGRYRKRLQTHVRQTRDHAQRVEQRLSELGQRESPVQFGVRLLENMLGPFFALGTAPLNILRGSGGPEKVLNYARDACATEAVQIARYTGIERLAESIGDQQTARLAASIRADEQKALDHLLEEIPSLTSWVVDAEVRGKATAAITENGAADRARSKGRARSRVATRGKREAKRNAPQTRAVSGVVQAREQAKGVTASERALPIGNYAALTADEIVLKLDALSQIDLAKVDSYEREHENRSPILSRVVTLRGGQQTPAHKEIGVGEINAARGQEGADRAPREHSYEGVHENRDSHHDAAQKELAGA